jgi:hypothetical protein
MTSLETKVSEDANFTESHRNWQLIYLNGTACFKNVNIGLHTNIYSHLEASGGQSSNLYLNVVHLFSTQH